MDRLAAQLLQFWNTLQLWQRALLIGVPAVLIVGAIAVISLVVGTPQTQVPLFRDLELADAGRIVSELKTQGVDYTLENGGRDIMVPASQVYDLRLELAGQGLPQGNVGFELFDQSKLGITETGIRIDFQRALQGELARTLEALVQVSTARVILQIAPETSFLDTSSRSTAAVALTLAPGQMLGESQVEGIKHLVSRAVPQLEPEDVAIIDGSGTPLTGREGAENGQMLAGLELAELRHRLRQRLERHMENKIRQFLEDPYGAGNVAASVSLEVDFRAIRSESKQYTPVVDDQGIEQYVEEHRKRDTTGSEQPGGVPGSTSNIPGYLGIAAGEEENKESSEYDLIVNYLVNEELVEEDLPPGTITRRTAAVALSTDSWDRDTKLRVDALVASAIGADTVAGDVIDVQAFQFSDEGTTAATVEYVASQRWQAITRIAGILLAVLLVGVALVFLRSMVMGVLPREAALAGGGLGLPGEPGLGPGEAADEFAMQKLDELGATTMDRMRTEISRLIDSEPERVASLLRSWLLEDS